MTTPEREKLKVDWKASFEALEKENAELMRELDRVREENKRWRDTVRDQDNELDDFRAKLDVAVEALDWITKWGDIHDVHGRKAYEALAKIRGEK